MWGSNKKDEVEKAVEKRVEREVDEVKAAIAKDLEKLPAKEKLPPGLQKIVDKADKDDSLYDELWDGT